MTADRKPSTVNVISQNVLLDKTRTNKKQILPQDVRIPSIAATFQAFPGDLDMVGIQEAYKSPAQHNGQALAELCGHAPGGWIKHNEKPYEGSPTGRAGEYVGLFGAMVDEVEPIEIGDNRRAAMTVVDDVAYVTFHLRAGWKARKLRREQAHYLAQALEPYENAVIFGDVNEPPIKGVALARAAFANAGFHSVFPLTSQDHPITHPVPSYTTNEANGRNRWEAPVIRRGWSLDDILLRGCRVQTVAAVC